MKKSLATIAAILYLGLSPSSAADSTASTYKPQQIQQTGWSISDICKEKSSDNGLERIRQYAPLPDRCFYYNENNFQIEMFLYLPVINLNYGMLVHFVMLKNNTDVPSIDKHIVEITGGDSDLGNLGFDFIGGDLKIGPNERAELERLFKDYSKNLRQGIGI